MKKLQRTVGIASLAAFLLLSVGCTKGCGSLQGLISRDEGLSPEDKLDLYIDCFNKAHDAVESTRADYLYLLKDRETVCKTGQTEFSDVPSSSLIDVLSESSLYAAPSRKKKETIQLCRKATERKLDTDFPGILKIATDYTAAYKDLGKWSREAYDYYRARKDESDDCRRGRELHPRVIDALDRLETLRDEFSNLLDTAEEERNRREIAALEKEGKRGGFDWLLLKYSMSAKVLIDLIPEEGQKSEAALFHSRFQDMEKDFESLKAYVETHAEEKLPDGAEPYYASSKKVDLALSEGKEELADRLMEYMIRDYNVFVESP